MLDLIKDLISLRRIIECSHNKEIFDDNALTRFKVEVYEKIDKIIKELKEKT